MTIVFFVPNIIYHWSNLHTFTVETGRGGRLPAMIKIDEPRLFDYTGTLPGNPVPRKIFFMVKYKYNSKYDPNQKSE